MQFKAPRIFLASLAILFLFAMAWTWLASFSAEK